MGNSPVMAETAVLTDTPDWNWSETTLISTESTDVSFDQDTAFDSENSMHVVWSDTTDLLDENETYTDIFYKKWDGNTWSTTIVISTNSTYDSASPTIVIDKSDNIHIAWQQFFSGFGYSIYYKYFDGTWSTSELISTESNFYSENPDLACDSNGTLHFIWQDEPYPFTDILGAGADTDLFYKTYNGTWSNTSVITTDSAVDSEVPSIAFDSEENLHVVYTEQWELFYIKLDSGVWTTAEDISLSVGEISLSPELAIDSEDNIHVVWHLLANSNTINNILYRKYSAEYEVWVTAETISDTTKSSSPSIAIDRADNIHIVWKDADSFAGPDIFYRYYDARPWITSWGTTTTVSTESFEESRSPTIDIDNNGFIHVLWHDINADSSHAGLLYRGYSWNPDTPTLTVTPETSDGSVFLDWNDLNATFRIYRDDSPILSIDGLTAIAEVSETYYEDTLSEPGTHYYAISAFNFNKNIISNTVGVYIEIAINNTETETVHNTVLETVTVQNDSVAESGFLDFPVLPLFFGSMVMITIIIRRKQK